MADNKVTVAFEVTGNAGDEFKKIASGAVSLDSTFQKAFGNAGRAFDEFKGHLAAEAVEKGFELLVEGAHKLFEVFVVEGVAAAARAQEAINNLNFALAASGNYTNQAGKDFLHFAEQIERTTKFSDEAVLSAGALLENLTNLDEKGLKRATLAALNMSAALGKDLTTSATLVAKAANGNVEAFQRLGIHIVKGKTDAESYANAMKLLEQRFGGAAAAQVNTYAGSLAVLHNEFEQVQKGIGKAVVSNVAVIDTFKAVGNVFGEMAEFLAHNQQQMRVWIAEATVGALQFAQGFVTAFGFVIQAGEVVFQSIQTIINPILATIATIPLLLKGEFTEAFNVIKGAATESADKVVEAWNGGNRLKKVADGLTEIKNAAVEGLAATENGAVAAVAATNQAGAAEENRAAKQLENDLKEVQSLQEKINLRYEITKNANDSEILDSQRKIDDIFAREKGSDDRLLKLKQQDTIARKKLNDQEVANRASSLATISTLMQNSTGTLFEIGKAAAVAKATIDGITAVQVALAAAPPPFNFALAALVGTAAAANVAQIVSTEPPHFKNGIDEVPAGFSGDNFPAFLQSGERVVPAETNKDLKNFLSGNGAMTQLLGSINDKLDRLSSQVVVNIGGREIINEIQSQINGGRRLAL